MPTIDTSNSCLEITYTNTASEEDLKNTKNELDKQTSRIDRLSEGLEITEKKLDKQTSCIDKLSEDMELNEVHFNDRIGRLSEDMELNEVHFNARISDISNTHYKFISKYYEDKITILNTISICLYMLVFFFSIILVSTIILTNTVENALPYYLITLGCAGVLGVLVSILIFIRDIKTKIPTMEDILKYINNIGENIDETESSKDT